MGSRDSIINKAVSMINDRCGLVISKSSFYESEPWGFESENAFLNQVIIIKTEKNAHELLKILLSIEIELGRDRKHHYDTGHDDREIKLTERPQTLRFCINQFLQAVFRISKVAGS